MIRPCLLAVLLVACAGDDAASAGSTTTPRPDGPAPDHPSGHTIEAL